MPVSSVAGLRAGASAVLAVLLLSGLVGCSSGERGEPVAEPGTTSPVSSPTAGTGTAAYTWHMSLSFDPSASAGGPAPTNGMNIVAHDGVLYAGTGTDGQPASVSNHRSYVYRKASAAGAWRLDADFGPDSGRVGAMESVSFAHDAEGGTIPGGPRSLLVAATNQNLTSTAQPVRARVRDDTTGRWTSAEVSEDTAPISQVREIASHRDSVTGADMVFLAASPDPFGIYSGTYDASAPGLIRWNSEPEVQANSDRKKQKWFGMVEANGALYASNNTGVFRRVDGLNPRWDRVADAAATGVDASTNPEWRGLVAVENPKAVTGWPEPQMLLFSYANAMWCMEAGGTHPIRQEYDLRGRLEAQFGYDVPLAEAAFNRPNPVFTSSGSVLWPIGFQFAHGSPPTIDDRAFYLLRDVDGHYTQQQIVDPSDPSRVLIVARDLVPSPFPKESDVLYATGYNASASNERANRGTAWVARGTLAPTTR